MNEPEQFVALVRDFPVSVDDEDAPWLAYLIWCTKVDEHGATPVSGESDLSIKEFGSMPGFPEAKVTRILGLARRGPE